MREGREIINRSFGGHLAAKFWTLVDLKIDEWLGSPVLGYLQRVAYKGYNKAERSLVHQPQENDTRLKYSSTDGIPV